MTDPEILTERTPSGWELRHTIQPGFRSVEVFGPNGVFITSYGWAEDGSAADRLAGESA